MKAVAIPYVIALILGVVVVALIGYWFVSQGGKTIGAGKQAECDSLCSIWRNSAFNAKPSNIEKVCPAPAGGDTALKVFCSDKLGCTLTNPSCATGEINYGVNIKSTLPVCCKS